MMNIYFIFWYCYEKLYDRRIEGGGKKRTDCTKLYNIALYREDTILTFVKSVLESTCRM